MEKAGYREAYNMLREKFPDKVAIDVSEVAVILGADVKTVYAAIRRRNNALPAKKLCGKWIVPITELARWMC